MLSTTLWFCFLANPLCSLWGLASSGITLGMRAMSVDRVWIQGVLCSRKTRSCDVRYLFSWKFLFPLYEEWPQIHLHKLLCWKLTGNWPVSKLTWQLRWEFPPFLIFIFRSTALLFKKFFLIYLFFWVTRHTLSLIIFTELRWPQQGRVFAFEAGHSIINQQISSFLKWEPAFRNCSCFSET